MSEHKQTEILLTEKPEFLNAFFKGTDYSWDMDRVVYVVCCYLI